MKFLKGRTNRAGYWACVVTLIVLQGIIMTFAPSNAHVSEVVLIFLAVPRLHDIGRTGWWVLVGLGLEILAIILSLVAVPPQHSLAVLGIATIFIAALMVWLGIIPGQAGENRFGSQPAPGLGARKSKV